MGWANFYECTKWISIGDGVEYRPHKHWGTGVWAGENQFNHEGDRSGCLTDYSIDGSLVDKDRPICPTVCAPIVVMQRIYRKGEKKISAVLSYPNGLSSHDEYFWEIYPINNDIERFFGENAEQEMEDKIKKEFEEPHE